MKRLALTLIALAFALQGCAMSPEQLRVAYHATNVADAATTAARDPACLSEGNPLLGSNPSDSTVALFALGQSFIYEMIYRHLADHDLNDRLAFGRVFLGIKFVTVGWNASMLAKGCN